ncbi:MAG: PadR family transcriptional regulator [Casimicrobium sp.]
MTRLLILWLLSEQPLHGYAIKRILENPSYSFWFELEFTSIYSALRTLVKLEYVIETGLEQEGARPERMGYRITRAGREHLRELVRKAWRATPLLGDAFLMAIAGVPELPQEEIAALKAERIAMLEARLAECKTLRSAALDEAMVERSIAMLSAELRWMKQWSQPK